MEPQKTLTLLLAMSLKSPSDLEQLNCFEPPFLHLPLKLPPPATVILPPLSHRVVVGFDKMDYVYE